MKSMLKTALCTAIALVGLSSAAEAQVRISQVFPGAGCGTAGCSAYNNDYVELYNAGPAAVDLSTWSIQYQAATTTGAFASGGRTNLTGMIQPGSYYLIQLGGNLNGLLALPTPDATGTTAMSGSAGKMALVQSQTSITGCTDANVVDLIGYGATANCSESAAAPAPGTNFNALFRADNGCTDNNNNSTDFTAAPAAPRNSTNTHSCGATTGACCVAEACTVVTPGNCTGTFQGLGSSCSPNPCIPQIGACCVNGFCVGDLTESACLANGMGSSWGGLGTTCGTFSCPAPTGACCNGTTCTSTVQAECTGTWSANIACTPTNPCDPAQACCIGGTSCLLRPSLECTALGGTPNGAGTTCDVGMNTCPVPGPGACCTGTACTLANDPIACAGSGGQFKGYNTACSPSPCFVGGGSVIATYDFDANVVGTPATNLSFTPVPDRTTTNGTFTNAFDIFGVTDRTVNADVADDSSLGADTFGILRSTQTSKLFGIEDLLNPDNTAGTGTATWTFNVAGFNNLNIAIDFAAMGNFEAFGTGAGSVGDVYNFTVSIDGGASTNVFVSNIYEGLTPTYTLESGATNTTTPDPAAINGTLVLNQFVTLAASIPGSGSTLTLTLNASNDGGSEVFLFDNIVIRGTPVGGATGACCSGSTCSVIAQAACTGTNTSYEGDGTVCNVSGNNTTPCCKADYNQSGAVTVQDIFDFLAGYFSNNLQADINASGSVTVQDIFDFLAAYFSGCA
jgi:hypothetical protein